MEKKNNSDRAQMRLVDKVDFYKWKINLLTQLTDLEKEKIEEKRAKFVDTLKEMQRRKFLRARLKTVDDDTAINELYGRKIEKFDKKQKLSFREYRQKLRREEGLLNKDGSLKRFELDANGNEVPFERKLSTESEQLIEAYKVSQAKEREDFVNELKKKAASFIGEKTESDKATYDAMLSEDEEKISATIKNVFDEKMSRHLENFDRKNQKKIDELNAKVTIMQEELASIMANDDNSVSLPDDVILRLDHLTMQFGGLKAVNDLSFDVKKGEIFGLIGPNGAGKTTVFNCITQFYKPTSGYVYYRNRENKVILLNKYNVHDVIKTGIVRTFQNVEVIYELSILDNLLIAAHTQYKSNIFAQMFNTVGVRQEESVNRKKALKVLEYCGLLEIKDLPPVGLPYGILKRIELARTLMAGASLIILDEPAAGLNDNETIELAKMIRRIRDEFDVTIFLVEHDMGLVMDICEHICAISFGKKLSYGTPKEIQADPVVQEAYLGTNDVKKEAQNG